MSIRPILISRALAERKAVQVRLKSNYPPAYVRVVTEEYEYYGISLNDALNLWADNRETDDSRVVTVG